MKQRAIKRCVKRAMKQVYRGTYRGRRAVVAPNMAGAIFPVITGKSYIQAMKDDCRWAWNVGEKLNDGHDHWFKRGHVFAVAVSYAK